MTTLIKQDFAFNETFSFIFHSKLYVKSKHNLLSNLNL